MGLFRRAKPLHEQLADAAGLRLDGELPRREAGQAADVPGWSGEARGEPGIHGVPRARRWDAVVTAQAPDLQGDRVHFVALPDRTLVVEEDVPDGALSPLADAIEATLRPPYRVEGVRRDDTGWTVAAARMTVAEAPGLEGEHAELVVTPDGRTLTVDGRPTLERLPEFERAGAAQGDSYVVRATKLDGDLWEVDSSPL